MCSSLQRVLPFLVDWHILYDVGGSITSASCDCENTVEDFVFKKPVNKSLCDNILLAFHIFPHQVFDEYRVFFSFLFLLTHLSIFEGGGGYWANRFPHLFHVLFCFLCPFILGVLVIKYSNTLMMLPIPYDFLCKYFI